MMHKEIGIKQPNCTICGAEITSCGATALAAALMELEVDSFAFTYPCKASQLRRTGGIANRRFCVYVMVKSLDSSRSKSGRTLYEETITRMHCACTGAKFGSHNLKHYFLPSRMVKFLQNARDISVEIYLNGCFFPKIMSYIYPQEEKELKELGVSVIRAAPPKLRDNQRMISCVTSQCLSSFMHSISSVYGALRTCDYKKLKTPIILHMLLVRPHSICTYMDPVNGKNYKNWSQLSGKCIGKYCRLGVDIVITKNLSPLRMHLNKFSKT